MAARINGSGMLRKTRPLYAHMRNSFRQQKEACMMVQSHLESLELNVWYTLPCRTKGSKGNQEYFIYAGMPHATNLAKLLNHSKLTQ